MFRHVQKNAMPVWEFLKGKLNEYFFVACRCYYLQDVKMSR